MSDKIVVVTCSISGLSRVSWAMRMKGQILPFGRSTTAVVVEGTSPVSAARNLGVWEAAKRGAAYCFFYDDDVLPLTNDAMGHLVMAMDLMPQATVLSGVVPIRHPTLPEPVVLKKLDDGPWYGWMDGGIHKVYNGGISFALIRMAHLDEIPVPTVEVEGEQVREFFQVYLKPGDFRGCDEFYFAELLEKHGKEWYINGSVVCDQVDHDGTRYSLQQLIDRVPPKEGIKVAV